MANICIASSSGVSVLLIIHVHSLFCLLQENWVTLVPEHDHDVLEWAACVNENKLVLCYLHDVKVSPANYCSCGTHFHIELVPETLSA